MSTGWGIIKTIVLPSTKAKAKLVLNDAQMVIQSLLTNPEIHPNDYGGLHATSIPFRNY